jgi:hypothetical protein
VFHVRSVTQGDVIRADAKDIPRIFQVGIFKRIKILQKPACMWTQMPCNEKAIRNELHYILNIILLLFNSYSGFCRTDALPAYDFPQLTCMHITLYMNYFSFFQLGAHSVCK